MIFQRQSRTNSNPADVMTMRTTAVQANVVSTDQGFLCAKNDANSASTSRVHITTFPFQYIGNYIAQAPQLPVDIPQSLITPVEPGGAHWTHPMRADRVEDPQTRA